MTNSYFISSIAPLSDYANNPVFQEIPTRTKYFASVDEKIFIDLRRGKGYTNEIEKLSRDDSDLTTTIQLKAPSEKKIRLFLIGYYQGDYLYSITSEGFIMNYKDYIVKKQKLAIR